VVEFVYEVILSILRIEMKKKKQNINGFIQELTPSAYITCSNNLLPLKNNTLLAKQLFLVLAIILCVISIATGAISTNVFLCDSNIPLQLVDPNIPHVYRDVMVGTKLKIVVSSDTNEPWSGDLGTEEAYWPYGILTPRDPLPAAGELADIYEQEETGIKWINFYTGSHDVETGDWFIIDYNAVDIGDFNIGFYDHDISWDDPNYYICFSNVRTRDLNNDYIVNFIDYGILTSYWLETNCEAPSWCEGSDLDIDGNVDINDLMLFCEFWLERTK